MKYDLYRLSRVEDPTTAASIVAVVLYGSTTEPRVEEVVRGFLEGVDDYKTGWWEHAFSVSPWSAGYNMAAIWSTRVE